MTVEIIQGDCLSVMAGMADGSVDMFLTDLPYEAPQNEMDKKIPFEPIWAHFLRLCPAGGVVVSAMRALSSAVPRS